MTKSYAVCIIGSTQMGEEVRQYLEEIDATLAPFQGKFIIHGGPQTAFEGQSPGDLVVIEFPDTRAAADWYNSAAYQGIARLRIRNTSSTLFTIEGVAQPHHATDLLR